ncbi:ARL14 effector protein isoform X1 [Vespula pensylvanica]|uniref:ARL14 effector protein isoform X1 n=1 Tax=Vespula pensylvanica TaxID=30213 RepID=UPI001CBA035C|nr:ARL14 effector protein isoform X1 [Vespula pensylvanica]
MSDEKILKTNMETNSSSKEATTQQVNNVEMPSRSRGGRGSRQRAVDNITKKFLRNFDPERSEREKRKLHRRLYQGSKRHTLYNDEGIWVITGDNLCDCLSLECAGCHFPCPKCSSSKCGHECRKKHRFFRINRKWTYDTIENEGSDVTKKNPVLKET